MASSSSASASASAQPDTASISIHITHRTQTHTLSLDPSTSVSSLRAQIEEITCVPVTHQKLLPSRARGVDLNVRAGASSSVATHEHDGVDGSVSEGSQGASEDGRTLTEAGVHGGMKIMVLGPSLEEVDRLRKADEEAGKRNAPRSYHPSMLRGTKPQSTAVPTKTRFHALAVHSSTPPSHPVHGRIHSYLERLSTDAGVLHVMALHDYTVGMLTELLPHEHPQLLGLNENKGQRISLRIRTDDYEGTRSYLAVRKVLLHELAHNDISDHPPEFKILNSELNAQLEAYQRASSSGSHTLGPASYYSPSPSTSSSSASTSEPGEHVLGGAASPSSSGSASRSNREERRARILMATMQRLEKEESEIEEGCGSGAGSGHGPAAATASEEPEAGRAR